MKLLYTRLLASFICSLCSFNSQGQVISIKGKVFDAVTKEAIEGATVTIGGTAKGTITDASGIFTLQAEGNPVLIISAVDHETKSIRGNSGRLDVELAPLDNKLQEIVVSGNRTAQRRSEVPVAISSVSAQAIADAKPNRLDQVLNQVSGVFMVSLGNEQHEMSIRQPMSTGSLFLYLEDGIPIRTTGVYNHNALLEMNMASAKSIEVIKGPASSLYGAEAIGGAVNLITLAPPAVTSGMVSVQADNDGYKRTDWQAGTTIGKWGVIVTGYYANRTNGPIAYSNFDKTAVTVRADYRASNKITWSNTVDYIHYYSDMTGALDSAQFADHNYSTPYSFTYRKVEALRVKSQLTARWNEHSSTQLALVYRNNSVGQNPSYYIYNSTTNPLEANGQVNDNAFSSYVMVAQHQQKFKWLKSKLIAGASVDISPTTYWANYLLIHRDAKGNYANFTPTDSSLSNYATGINNLAAYANYEMSPVKGLRLVGALRYDFYHYGYQNHLPVSAYSGAPSTNNDFNRVTPKLGATYNYKSVGFYANYSQGFVPPQITDLYSGVKVPFLKPQTFFNEEVGGWLSLFRNKLYADYSLYLMHGTNEIISIEQANGTFQNENAGKTRHEGIEYGITYRPDAQWMFRLSATNVDHRFITQYENGANYSGNAMSAAPHFIANAEAMYKPVFLKGFRIGAEWQHQGKYWMDDANTKQYNGFDIVNFRTGYVVSRYEIWVNALNAFDRYYSILASKSSYGYSYNLGDPRAVTVGLSYHFGKY